MTEFRDDWPDEADAIIYCTPQDAVKNMNLGAGIDPTQVRSKNVQGQFETPTDLK